MRPVKNPYSARGMVKVPTTELCLRKNRGKLCWKRKGHATRHAYVRPEMFAAMSVFGKGN